MPSKGVFKASKEAAAGRLHLRKSDTIPVSKKRGIDGVVDANMKAESRASKLRRREDGDINQDIEEAMESAQQFVGEGLNLQKACEY